MNKIIRNLRTKHLSMALAFGFWGLGGLAIALYFAVGFVIHRDAVGFIPFIICILFAPLLIWLSYRSAILAINPLKCSVFKKYGSLEQVHRLVQEIEQSKEFDDGNIIISQDYILDPKDVEGLFLCDEVIEVHKVLSAYRCVVDDYYIEITDKSGSSHRFNYKIGEEVRLDFAIDFLQIKCLCATFGPPKTVNRR